MCNGAIVVAVLQNTQVSMSQLLAANALNVGAPITPIAVQPLMHMGCTNDVITAGWFRKARVRK
jgi:hypothetical protein